MFKLNINTNFKRIMKDTNASPPLSFLCCHLVMELFFPVVTYLQA